METKTMTKEELKELMEKRWTKDVQLAKLDREREDLDAAYEHLAMAEYHLKEKEAENLRYAFEDAVHALSQATHLKDCCQYEGPIWQRLKMEAGRLMAQAERELWVLFRVAG